MINTRETWALARQAKLGGIEPKRLLEGTGWTVATLEDPDTELGSSVELLWGRAAAMTGDPFIAMRCIDHVPEGAFQELDYLAMSCDTLGEGLEVLARYFRIANTVLRWTIERRADGYAIIPIGTQPMAGYAIGLLLHQTAQAFGTAQAPKRVELRGHRYSADPALRRRRFGTQVQAAPRDAIVWSVEQWNRPLPGRNPGLRRVLERRAQELLARVPCSFLEEVSVQIACCLGDRDPTVSLLSGRLGMSPRTLQRRLKSEGTTFQQVLDDTRQRLSQEWLLQAPNLIEVAERLGYSDESTFLRAFKRWTGTTPIAWCKHQKGVGVRLERVAG